MCSNIDMSLDDIVKKAASSRGRGRGRGRGAARGAARGSARGAVKTGSAAGRGAAATGRGGGRTLGASRGAIKKVSTRGRGRGRGGTLKTARQPKQAELAPCLVGASTDIKAAAGYVCAGLREGAAPPVMAIAPANVNNACKLLALAHSYLAEENLDLYAQVDFPEYQDSPMTASVKLYVFKKARRSDLSHVSEQMFVNASSDPPKVAGYIANCMRQSQLGRICVTAAGAQAMLRALKSIYLARHYLQEDALDLSIVPEFGKSDDGISLVNIFVLSHAVGARI